MTVPSERHKAFITLSNYERSIALHPLRTICQGKRVLDLGCHFGLNAYEALQLGALHATAIDSDPACVAVARQILGSHQRVNVLQKDLSAPNALADIKGIQPPFETIFYLGLHNHLERWRPGSGYSLLEEIIEMKPEFIAVRSFVHGEQMSNRLLADFGKLCFFSKFDKLGTLMIFQSPDQEAKLA